MFPLRRTTSSPPLASPHPSTFNELTLAGHGLGDEDNNGSADVGRPRMPGIRGDNAVRSLPPYLRMRGNLAFRTV
jgi:hypothetical protein